jgi:hypothetical protein
MAARLHPDIWFEFATGVFTDGVWGTITTYRWSTKPLADPSTYEGGWKEGRVVKGGWEPIERTLSDPSGHYETSKFGCTVNDTDRLMRGWLGDISTENLVNREASVKLISDAGRRAGTTPRIIGRGKIRDPKPLGGMTFSFSGEDIIGGDIISGTKKLPQRLMTRELFDDIHRDMIGKPQPIIYGEVSDDGALDENGEPAAKGLVPVFWCGQEQIDGEEWERFLVAGHACKDIHSWFASDLGSPAKRVQMDESTLGTEFLIPGQTGWPHPTSYFDRNDGRHTHRCTFILAKGERAQAHIDGSINITVNVCGVEDIGDGTGELLREGFKVKQHFETNWIMANDGQGYFEGVWQPLPEWSLAGPTVSVIKTETYEDCQAFSATRLGDGVGYLCDFWLGDQIDVREAIRRFNVSLDCYTGINRHAQLITAMLDDTADTSSATVFREFIEIAQMPPPKIAHEEIENHVMFAYDFDADKGKFRADQEFIEDTVSQDALGGEVRKSDLLKMYMVRDPATARDAAARRLLRLKRAPRYQDIVMDLMGLEHDLTELFRVTHHAGIGSDGYDDHPFFCVRHKIDLNALTVTLTGLDLSRITAVAATAMQDETAPGFDDFLLGDETSAAAPPTGAYELR